MLMVFFSNVFNFLYKYLSKKFKKNISDNIMNYDNNIITYEEYIIIYIPAKTINQLNVSVFSAYICSATCITSCLPRFDHLIIQIVCVYDHRRTLGG